MRAYSNLCLNYYWKSSFLLDEKMIKDHFSSKDVFLIKQCFKIKDKSGDTASLIEKIIKISTIDMTKAPIFY
jgi:hypothetical protein